MQVKKYNEEVFFALGSFIEVKRKYIELLKEKCLQNKSKKARLCTHKDVNDMIHEMLIVHTKNTYIRPHKHLNKIESFHVIEGFARVIVFDENGKIIRVAFLGDYFSNRSFYWKFAESYYHTLLIDSDFFVFHEIANGPFKKTDTIFAQWSPIDTDKINADKFVRRISEGADKFLNSEEDKNEDFIL